MRYFVRCVAGGSVIASQDKDEFGQPLTKQSAKRLCNEHNRDSQRRRERKLPYAFDYYVQETPDQVDCFPDL